MAPEERSQLRARTKDACLFNGTDKLARYESGVERLDWKKLSTWSLTKDTFIWRRCYHWMNCLGGRCVARNHKVVSSTLGAQDLPFGLSLRAGRLPS
eukprot:6461458-Amphidinium_carterae.3